MRQLKQKDMEILEHRKVIGKILSVNINDSFAKYGLMTLSALMVQQINGNFD